MPPFDFSNLVKESESNAKRVSKLSKSFRKNTIKPITEDLAIAMGQLLLGISDFEDIDTEALCDPEIIAKVEILTKLKAFASILEVDAAFREALQYLRSVLADDTATRRDKIQACSVIMGSKNKQQKEIYELLDVFKDAIIPSDDSKPASSMTEAELAKSIHSVINYIRK